jgi:hypothetical protein
MEESKNLGSIKDNVMKVSNIVTSNIFQYFCVSTKDDPSKSLDVLHRRWESTVRDTTGNFSIQDPKSHSRITLPYEISGSRQMVTGPAIISSNEVDERDAENLLLDYVSPVMELVAKADKLELVFPKPIQCIFPGRPGVRKLRRS